MFDIAFAETASTSTAGSLLSGVPLIVLIFVLFWFLIIRPQSKKMKEHRNLINSLQKGDKVLTHSGIIGRITKINEEIITIDIADGTNVQFDKNYIARKINATDKIQASK